MTERAGSQRYAGAYFKLEIKLAVETINSGDV